MSGHSYKHFSDAQLLVLHEEMLNGYACAKDRMLTFEKSLMGLFAEIERRNLVMRDE